jgi:DNA gyrase subunit A
MGRSAQGVRILSLDPPDFVIGLDRIVQEDPAAQEDPERAGDPGEETNGSDLFDEEFDESLKEENHDEPDGSGLETPSLG